MPTTLSRPIQSTPEPPTQQAELFQNRGAYLVVFAAGLAFIAKLLIALNTFGTNDVTFFYQFGKSLSQHGMKWTYMSDVACNHPPLVADFHPRDLSVGSYSVDA